MKSKKEWAELLNGTPRNKWEEIIKNIQEDSSDFIWSTLSWVLCILVITLFTSVVGLVVVFLIREIKAL